MNSMNRTVLTAATSAMILIVPMTMSGCLIASSKDSHISGAYVQPGAVSQVKINTTTTTQVEELLGLPSTTKANDDGTETWTWKWTKRTQDDGAVLLIFAGDNDKTVHESVHIKFADGIAIKKWRD